MNISVAHQEETTTAHFSGNIPQVACYPVVVKYNLEREERSRKGGIVFLSSDRKHDFQQVEVFEKRVFTFMKEKHGIKARIWHRFLPFLFSLVLDSSNGGIFIHFISQVV